MGASLHVLYLLTFLFLLAALAGCWMLSRHYQRLLQQKEEERQSLAQQLALKSQELNHAERFREAESTAHRQALQDAQDLYDRTLQTVRSEHRQQAEQQFATLKAEMTAQTEQLLKAREQELADQARKTFEHISTDLGKNLKDMQQAFEQQKKTQTETSAELKNDFEHAVKHLREETERIGNKADHLADALRGQHKMQGCWGETLLNNMFLQEGMVEGRDFDKEATLKDDMGIVILNEDTGKRMRPDFILHLPDRVDIIIDSKVSLDALVDWQNARTEQERDIAMQRNLQAVKDQVRRLADKRYAQHASPHRRSIGYVIMFIPNYTAFQLAKQLEPQIFNEAFKQNVLITTEETLMPFLRIIHNTWTNYEQVQNQEKMIKAAQLMIDRVADFCQAHAQVGKKLQEAVDIHERSARKLNEGGQSIVHAARQVVSMGVPVSPNKKLPSTTGIEDEPDELPM